jgi:thioredoxin-dependent peroxiredoxin
MLNIRSTAMRTLTLATSTVVATLVLGAVATAFAADDVKLKVGDDAPQFILNSDQGNEWKSEDHYGKKIVVVYFYPADMTPGCTAQACSYRDDLSKLADKGVEVVGVSGDSVRNHQLFKIAHELNYTLLSDPEGTVAARFGVPFNPGTQSIEREINGQAYTLTRTTTIQRWTFVVDKNGKIADVRDLRAAKVAAGDDSKSILEIVESLE